ncbi:unnamed protein product [Pleuronectes platessa]|uniref:Uncharacterized protein n=1 Tax=Pleuronectes platessa TaxID=8262 RepID=A0A9N7VV25_PLEPL|nr:unnamed protein product [Pleuronectes platessa]
MEARGRRNERLDSLTDIPPDCLVDSLDDAGSGIVSLYFLEVEGCLEITKTAIIYYTPGHGNAVLPLSPPLATPPPHYASDPVAANPSAEHHLIPKPAEVRSTKRKLLFVSAGTGRLVLRVFLSRNSEREPDLDEPTEH